MKEALPGPLATKPYKTKGNRPDWIHSTQQKASQLLLSLKILSTPYSIKWKKLGQALTTILQLKIKTKETENKNLKSSE